MEEALRAYFLHAGYYALRSVQLRYQDIDVTDIDIWLYERPSSVSRHRIIVDAKNRKTPQVIERIFWTKGLQLALGVEQSIVATTDRRSAVVDFGRQHDVLVLDGAFVARLIATMREEANERLVEEEFQKLLHAYRLASGALGWRRRLDLAKSVVLNGLDYDAINFWLEEGRYFAEQAITIQGHASTAMRALYLISSLIALAIDFALKELSFVDGAQRLAAIADGLRYGTRGQIGTKKVLDLATGLVEQYVPGGRAAASRMRHELNKELGALQTNILAEFFARNASAQSMFAAARELEAAAYARRFSDPATLQAGALSLLGVLADYWGIERVKLLGKPAQHARSQNLPRAEDDVGERSTGERKDPDLLL